MVKLLNRDRLLLLGKMQVLAFKSTDVPRLLETFKVRTGNKGQLVFSKKRVKCACCGKELTKKNLGSVFPSSPYNFYCDNPVCIVEYVRKTKFKK